MKLKEIKAIVVHWDDPQGGTNSIEGLSDYLTERATADYHYLVKGLKMIQRHPTNKKLWHCGNKTYTVDAQVWFGGRYCPAWTHSAETPHTSSPNNCTLAVCLLSDYAWGAFSNPTMTKGAALVASLLHSLGLTMAAIWRHSDIVGHERKTCPKPFYEGTGAWSYFLGQVERNLNALDKTIS